MSAGDGQQRPVCDLELEYALEASLRGGNGVSTDNAKQGEDA